MVMAPSLTVPMIAPIFLRGTAPPVEIRHLLEPGKYLILLRITKKQE